MTKTEIDSQAPALELSSVSHSFKSHQALSNVSFTVAPQSIHGFVGPNGAGKTTSLKIISTLLTQKRGEVQVFGVNTRRNVYKVRRLLGFMPDHFSMYRQMTVYEYLDFFGAAYGLGYGERTRVINDVLQITDMDKRRNSLIQGLSRGMEQRVSLARILVNDPKLLLLDEPASGLDPRARVELMEIIRELRNMGKTIFISSHILSELADLCDSVTIIDHGKVKFSGQMADLLKSEEAELIYEIEFAEIDDKAIQDLSMIDGLADVKRIENRTNWITLKINQNSLTRNELLQVLLKLNLEVVNFKMSQKQLNQVFMDLTSPGVRG